MKRYKKAGSGHYISENMSQESAAKIKLLVALMNADAQARNVAPKVKIRIANAIAHGQVTHNTHTTPTLAGRIATQYEKAIKSAAQRNATAHAQQVLRSNRNVRPTARGRR